MKHDLKGKQEKSEHYGFVSSLQRVPLFDRADKSGAFSRDLYDRRQKEIDECALKAGFKMTEKTNGRVTFTRI